MTESDRKFRFPFAQPYSIQLDLMRTAYDAIENRKIAFLCSPTGTGKSLSLVCSSLAWLHLSGRNNTQEQQSDLSNEPLFVRQWAAAKHKQISEQDSLSTPDALHSVKKHRRLNLHDDFALDAPEDEASERIKQLQAKHLHFDVAQKSSHNKDMQAIAQRTKIIFVSRTHSQLSQVLSELQKTSFKNETTAISLASRKQLCINPKVQASCKTNDAFNSKCKEMQKDSSVRCPYLPTLDDPGGKMQNFVGALKLQVNDIEDTAAIGTKHQTCPYYGVRHALPDSHFVAMPYSMLLSPRTRKSLGISLKDNIVIIDEAHNLIDAITQLHSCTLSLDQIVSAAAALKQYSQKYAAKLKGSNMVYIKQLILILNRLQQRMQKLSQSCVDYELSFSIADFVHQLHVEHLNMFELQSFIDSSDLAKKIMGFLDKIDSPMDESPLYNFVNFIVLLNSPQKDGRILVQIDRDKENSKTATIISNFKFLLLNPAEYFSDIVNEARCVLMAGGTMDNTISQFKHELFPDVDKDRFVSFSCNHIIPDGNLLTYTLPVGPSGYSLEYTFEKRTQVTVIHETGLAILELAKCVPAGMVVFFPSYCYMDTVLKLWSKGTLMSTINKEKHVLVEPREASELDKVLTRYEVKIKEPKSKGAILLAVVGGKMSEGINFADDMGRAVVMVGLPFPNLHSAEMKQKMAYMDKLGVRIDVERSEDKPSGQAYYENVCMIAVNQSIGRAIRHRNDHACVILLDCRYSKNRIRQKLPGWMQSSVTRAKTFEEVSTGCRQFFNGHSEIIQQPTP